jgi:hypothetical protein
MSFSSGKTLTVPSIFTDTLTEKTASAGVSVASVLNLNSVATTTAPTYMLTLNGTEVQKAAVVSNAVNFFDDFTGVVITNVDFQTSNVCFDKPWVLYSNVLSELKLLTDLGSSMVNQYADMVGAVYLQWQTPGGMTQRYLSLCNGCHCTYTNGPITYSTRLRLKETSSSAVCFTEQSLQFGLGRDRITSNSFDLNGVVGFKYDSSQANWGVIFGGVGAAIPTVVYGSVPVDTYSHTFMITVTKQVTITDAEVRWYIDGINVYTTVVSGLTSMGPRLLHTYTKNSYSLPTDLVGVVLDFVAVNQPFAR